MTFGVIRRAVASIGLLALVPTAVMVMQGYITPLEGGIRAGITLVAVMVVARIVTRGLVYLAKHPGTRVPEHAPDAERAIDVDPVPQRRRAPDPTPSEATS